MYYDFIISACIPLTWILIHVFISLEIQTIAKIVVLMG